MVKNKRSFNNIFRKVVINIAALTSIGVIGILCVSLSFILGTLFYSGVVYLAWNLFVPIFFHVAHLTWIKCFIAGACLSVLNLFRTR